MIKMPFPWAGEKLSTRYRSISQWGCLQLSSNRNWVHLSFSPSLQLFLKLIYWNKFHIPYNSPTENMGTRGGRSNGMNWDIGIDIYTLLCMKQITNENLLYSTENSTNVLWWYNWRGNPKKKGYMYTNRWFTLLYSRN